MKIPFRFAFEFAGGHIRGAANFEASKDGDKKQRLFDYIAQVAADQQSSISNGARVADSISNRLVLVFHCEYSQYRGPYVAGEVSKYFASNHSSRILAPLLFSCFSLQEASIRAVCLEGRL